MPKVVRKKKKLRSKKSIHGDLRRLLSMSCMERDNSRIIQYKRRFVSNLASDKAEAS